MPLIPVNQIVPNPEQPRREFDPLDIDGLADSIRQHGLINPIAVEQAASGYILIDGERRWRASKIAGLTEIEASVRPSQNGNGQKERLILALTANLQRQDMTVIEEAQAFEKMRQLGYSVQEITDLVGLAESNIYIRLKMLELEPEIQELFAQKALPTHGQTVVALLKLPDDQRVKLAQSFARKKTPASSILAICRRVANAQDYPSAPIRGNGAPAMHIAVRARHSGPAWDAERQIGKLPPFETVKAAAEKTCHKCPLSENANQQVCRDCPAVDLLKFMLEAA